MEEAICVESSRPSVLCQWQIISFICRPAPLSWPDVTPERRKRQSTQTAFDLMPQHFLFLDLPDYQTVLVFEISLLYVSWKRSLLCCVFVVRTLHVKGISHRCKFMVTGLLTAYVRLAISLHVLACRQSRSRSRAFIHTYQTSKGTSIFFFFFIYINIVQQNRGCSVLCWKKLF